LVTSYNSLLTTHADPKTLLFIYSMWQCHEYWFHERSILIVSIIIMIMLTVLSNTKGHIKVLAKLLLCIVYINKLLDFMLFFISSLSFYVWDVSNCIKKLNQLKMIENYNIYHNIKVKVNFILKVIF